MQEKDTSPLLKYCMYLLMGVYGVTITIVAPLLDSMIREFRLDLTQGGLINSVISFGGILSTIVVGVIADKIVKKNIIVVCYGIFAVSMLLLAGAKSYLYLLIFFTLIGVGTRAVDAQANVVIRDAYPKRAVDYTNIMHTFLGVGAIIGPVISGKIIGAGMNWRIIFVVLGILCAVLTVVFFVITKNDYKKPNLEKGNSINWLQILKNKQLWPLCAAVFFYAGHQTGLASWISYYFVNSLGTSRNFSGYPLALYWVGIVAGRLLCAKFYNAGRARAFLTGGSICSVPVLLAGFIFANPILILLGLFIAGVLTGGLIPILVVLAGRIDPQRSGAITSFLFLFIWISPVIFSAVMGKIGDLWGIGYGMYVTVLTLIGTFAATLFVNVRPEQQ